MRHARKLALTLAAGGAWGGVATAQDAGGSREALEADLRQEAERNRQLSVQLHAQTRKSRKLCGTRGAWAVHPDGRLIAAGTPDGTVEVWKSDATRPHLLLHGHFELVRELAFVPGSSVLYTVGFEGVAREWDLGDGALLAEHGEPMAAAERPAGDVDAGFVGVSCSPDGRFVAFRRGPQESRVELLDRSSGKWVDPAPPESAAGGAAFLGDSRRLLLVSGILGAVLRDVTPAPVPSGDGSAPDRRTLADPVWRLRTKWAVLRSEPPVEPELGDADYLDAATVNRPSNTVVTLERRFLGGRDESVLSGREATTGKRKWQRPISADVTCFLDAPASTAVVLPAEHVLLVHSAKDGSFIRSIPFDAKSRRPAVLAPDASVGYDADRNGNLIRIPLLATPAPTPAPAAPPSAPPPAPGTGK